MKKKTTKELEKSMKEIIEIEEKRQDLRIELTNLIQNKIVNNFKDAEGNNCLYEVTIKGKKQMQSLEDLWIAFQELFGDFANNDFNADIIRNGENYSLDTIKEFQRLFPDTFDKIIKLEKKVGDYSLRQYELFNDFGIQIRNGLVTRSIQSDVTIMRTIAKIEFEKLNKKLK